MFICRLFWLCVICFPSFCFANNLQIGPVSESVSSGNHILTFTVSWENSWRLTSNPGNYDAVWIFVKRRDCAATQWQHAELSDQDANHTAGSPLFADAYPDKKGVMLYRATPGAGNITSVTVQLRLDALPSGSYEYKVFGIEMVYIPQDAFYLGDGTATYRFQTGSTSNPFLLGSEAAISISPNGSDLWSTAHVGPFTLPTAYPKGYQAFYCMKYEISQGQYADFLNSLPQDAFNNRYDATRAGVSRYTISGSWPNVAAAAPDRACNWISIEDLCAYLDWSALSPMTELEFEKICRGGTINLPVSGEFAWGGNGITDANTIVPGTDGTPSETVTDPIMPGTGLANYNNSGILGPLRSGFAAKASTTRFEAGASYYGVMEMSGNVYELCINADSSQYGIGFRFNGNHGDGQLSITPAAGYANQNWPGQPVGDFNEQYNSFAARGGAWSSVFSGIQLQISDRNTYLINTTVAQPDLKGRNNSFGGRGVSRR